MLLICKTSLFMLLFNLYCYFGLTGNYIPYGTVIFGSISVVSMLVDMIIKKRILLNQLICKEFRYWGAFILMAFITAPFIANNLNMSFDALIQFSEKVVFAIVIYYICICDQKIDYSLNIIIITSCIAAIIVLFTTTNFTDRLSLTDNANPNKLGNMMLFGIFALLYQSIGRKKFIQFVSIALCCLLGSVLFLSGSRKSFFALIILIILLLLIKIIENMRKGLKIKAGSLIFFIVIGIGLIVVYNDLEILLRSSSLYERLFGRLSERAASSDTSRIILYKNAFIEWLTHPIFGIGFMNFVTKYNLYTHSTYAEIFACCGTIGACLYFIPYIYVGKRMQRKTKKIKKHTDEKTKAYFISVFAFIYLFIGIGLGQIYDNLSLFQAGILIGFSYLSSSKSQSADKM